MKLLWGLAFLLLAGVMVVGAQENQDTKKNGVEFDAFFRKLDANLDGKLTKEEFLKMADRAKEKAQARKKLGEAYDKLDPQRKGLSKEAFKIYIDERKK
jgi:hypothetical protein